MYAFVIIHRSCTLEGVEATVQCSHFLESLTGNWCGLLGMIVGVVRYTVQCSLLFRAVGSSHLLRAPV